MKWKKYCELRIQHPFIEQDLGRKKTTGASAKNFVRTKVNFIAFRPFASLDLCAKPSCILNPLKSDYVHVQMGCYKSVDYDLSFHVEGEGDGTRLRYVHNGIGDGSIQAHLDDITRWFESCETFRGKKLIWERVIKSTMHGSSYAGLTGLSLEIYPFPKAGQTKEEA